jgi:ubiquinone/menaquinone biosynthesis C-methylase UbiE
MIAAPSKPITPPLAILPIVHSTWAHKAVATAVELELFDAVKNGERTADVIASKRKLSAKGVELLLDAAVSLGILEKNDHGYALNEMSELYLVKSSPLYLGDFIGHLQEELGRSWNNLAACVRTGKPAEEVNKVEAAEKFFPALAAAIFPLNYGTAHMVVNKLKLNELKAGARVLDLAAGSGVWTIPIAQTNKGVTIDALDFPPVLEVTKKFASEHGVSERYKYLSGGWQDITLSPETYDAVVLGHILHSEGRTNTDGLLKKIQPAMKPGGQLIIAEFLENEGRTGPAFAALFAINMFLNTTQGCVFTLSELEKLLKSAGFHEVQRLELPFYKDESPIIVATRK